VLEFAEAFPAILQMQPNQQLPFITDDFKRSLYKLRFPPVELPSFVCPLHRIDLQVAYKKVSTSQTVSESLY
jgi:hypothetical protein